METKGQPAETLRALLRCKRTVPYSIQEDLGMVDLDLCLFV